MSQTVKTLQLLKQIRGRAVSELTGQLSQQKKLCQSYQNNIDALSALKDEQPQAAKFSPAIMNNQSSYKTHIQRMIDWQKQEFILADKQAQALQKDLVKEACKEKTVELVLNSERDSIRLQQNRQEQKVTDSMSTQAWMRQQLLAGSK